MDGTNGQEKLLKGADVQSRLKDLMQKTLQEALEGELEEFLGHGKNERSSSGNTRNGYSSKMVSSSSGAIELNVPRDRKSEFEPKAVKKRQTVLDDLESKIIALYSKGMTTRDIQDILHDIYGVEISPSLISRLTDRIFPRLEEWQARPLQSHYVIIWLDCIFYKVREENKFLSKAIYVVVGLNLTGHKEILGFWSSQKENSAFWLGVLNDLKNRGVKDVFIFSVDGLTGLEDAIRAAYPLAEVQRCVVHQIRNSLKYVSWKEKKVFAQDLKKVYGAATLEEAAVNMDAFEEKWGDKHAHAVKSWRTNWNALMSYFRHPVEIRKIMYTTNLIENVNSMFRKATDVRKVFPSDDAVFKSLYMAVLDIEKKWTMPIRDWGVIYNQLAMLFEGRLP